MSLKLRKTYERYLLFRKNADAEDPEIECY